jgi:hypothetical protein
MAVTTTVSVGLTSSLNFPLLSVEVPFPLPFILMEAPFTATLSSAFTTPEISRSGISSWASAEKAPAVKQKMKKDTIKNPESLFMITALI